MGGRGPPSGAQWPDRWRPIPSLQPRGEGLGCCVSFFAADDGDDDDDEEEEEEKEILL